MSDGRNSSGQFANGNKFGIGRPKRAVELDYIAALSDAVPVETWRGIVKRAVDDAANGDDKARTWLSKYLLGARTLDDAAQLEALGVTPADYVRAVVDADANPVGDKAVRAAILGEENLMLRARRLVESEKNEQRNQR